jgi:periplasmic divalent cation tolerance protein
VTARKGVTVVNEPPDVAVVCTAVESEEAARNLARLIVESRLAACVQHFPIRSVYRWKGAVEESAEILLTAKTRGQLAEPLIRFIRGHHSYEVPEILVFPVAGGLAAYLAWVADETRLPSESF